MFVYQAIELSPAIPRQFGCFGYVASGSAKSLDKHHPLSLVKSPALVALDGISRAVGSRSELFRKVGDPKCLAGGKYHGPFDHVPELPDVAGP